MEKILKDRLNHLKSLVAQERRVKLTKRPNQTFIEEALIRIEEIEYLLTKIEK